jgi:hypothetical protein
MPPQKRLVFLLKGSGPMVFDLILDVTDGFCQLGDAHAESAITLLPTILNLGEIRLIVPLGRGNFPHDSRHIVPGYYQAVPPDKKPFAPGAPRVKLTLTGFHSVSLRRERRQGAASRIAV